ncbi:low temperature requirement protein A [Ectopseudomonas alcaliphila]|uniref:low temperature requirement protein A n=1 Tax=Ectopseudomonas alcaliphila TaxID=101564 RepID=UPI00278A2EB0|nr:MULTISPECIES: low temperature requirement protein A [Pseudomonas]MDP9937889.1 low temperature requirement protein LtrA [Pseudomonas sp. 3400]MDR7010112.1 low temperature requirement protein LtrA [Pseudomonas alcaliphila]
MDIRRFLLSGAQQMHPRAPEEPHRTATPLELLFDLVFVIAIAYAAAGLHHAIAGGHITQGIATFIAAFFAIWWGWMNFTWFASAYDNDDALYRALTLVIMAGALTVAVGVERLFDSLDLGLIVLGFIIMRVPMAALWLRARRHDSARKTTTLIYATGLLLVQGYWLAIVLMPQNGPGLFFISFAIGALLELCVPVIAESRGETPWHKNHIIERYGLLNIIVMGETLLAGSKALSAADSGHITLPLLNIALLSLLIIFALWWLYFSKQAQIKDRAIPHALYWGYGHALIYMAGAAIGSGFAVLVDTETGASSINSTLALYAICIPISMYIFGIWLIRDIFLLRGTAKLILPGFALIILVAPLFLSLEIVATITILSVLLRNHYASEAYCH